MQRIKYFFFVIFLFCIFTVHGQDYNLNNGITLNEQNRGAGITVTYPEEITLNSLWDRGRVIRYSNDPNNVTNLGKFVEIEYELGFTFEGVFMSQGKIRVIFSNLSEIFISENSIISTGTLLVKTQRGTGNGLRVFILSENDNLSFLQLLTNNSRVRIGDFWYWNPAFLFR